MAWDYTLQIIIAGAALLGFVSGCLGSFAVLRKQSLLGDAISHAALPGIAIAFLLTYSKHPLIILGGAFLAGWIGTLGVTAITKTTKLKEDAALGIILSVFFGFGIFLLTIISRLPTSEKAGLDKFLFGSAATLLQEDVFIMAILGVVVLLMLFFFWKEFKLLSFDPDYAQSLGFPIKRIALLLTTLIVIAIVIGLQTVGVVLMSAMIIAPAVAARQWTDRLGIMVLLAGIFGAASGLFGALISASVEKLPTGPTIVLVMSAIVAVSLLFSPHRGLSMDWITSAINKRKIEVSRTLYQLFKLSQSHADPYHAHDISSFRATNLTADRSLSELESQGMVMQEDGKWHLTKGGLMEAKRLGGAK